MDSYTVTVQEDTDGNIIIPIPDDVLFELGWEVGTEIDIETSVDGDTGVIGIFAVEPSK